jgi:hypothetical protein
MMRAARMIDRRGRCRGASPDDGVSVVEVLISLTILLIALTAIIALMSSTTIATRLSRQKAAMINAGASYLERARQTDWINVGTPNPPLNHPGGHLTTETVTIDGFIITIVPTVDWGRPEEIASQQVDNSYKTIRIRVTVPPDANNKITEWVMSTMVNEWGLGTNPASARITAPPGGTVIWAPVAVGIEAATNSPSRDLLTCTLYDGGNYSNSSVVIGSGPMEGRSDDTTFTWNVTTATREGWHRIYAQVTDNGPTQANSDGLLLLIDFDAPIWPTGAAITSPFESNSTTSATFYWTPAQDGTDTDWVTPVEADHYITTLGQQPVSANPNDYTLWPVLQTDTHADPTTTTALFSATGLQDFARFALVVGASSPDRGAGSGLLSTSSLVGTSISNSVLSGTWAAYKSSDHWLVDVVVGIPSGPRFPWTGTATTNFYKVTYSSLGVPTRELLSPGGTITSTSPTWSGTTVTGSYESHHETTLPPVFYIVAETVITPTGFGSASTTVRSCTLGPPADPGQSTPQAMLVVNP